MVLEKGVMVFNGTFNNISVIAFSFIGRGWKMVEIDRHPFLSIGRSTIRYKDIMCFTWSFYGAADL
jgi:glutamine cyclotransferase